MTFRRLNHASKWTRYIYIHVHISFHNSVSKSALCTILWCWSVLMVESPCKGFQVDLGISHAPPERITLYAISCYDCKTIKLGLPYYTIRHWIPAIQYTCLRYFKFCMFRVIPNIQVSQEHPKLGVEGPAVGGVVKASCCRVPQPTGRSGYHTGKRWQRGQALGPLSSGGSTLLYPLWATKIRY